MSGSQHFFHNSSVFIKEEQMFSGEECPIFKEQRGDELQCFGKLNDFQLKENSVEVNLSDAQNTSHHSRVIIKEESISSDEECTIFEDDQCEDGLQSFRKVNTLQSIEPPKTEDVSLQNMSSSASSQFTIKEEILSFDNKCALFDKEKSKDDSKDHEIFDSSQLNRGGYELLNVEPSLTHHVFIKEEINCNDEVHSSNMKELTHDEPLEDNTFGSHFLASCFEPQYQYANGQSADCEQVYVNETGPIVPLAEDINQAQFRESESFRCNTSMDKQDPSYQKYLNTDGHKKNEMGNIKYCKRCQFSTRNMTKMRLHLWDIHQELIPPPVCCQYCLFHCRTKQSLQLHVISKHNFGQMPIDCPYCKFKSLSILEVLNHIQEKHHKEKKFQYCPHCEYKNINIGNVRYHIAAKHTKKMNFFCPKCDYKCILGSCMKRHLLKMHNKRVNNLSSFTKPISKNVSDIKIKS